MAMQPGDCRYLRGGLHEALEAEEAHEVTSGDSAIGIRQH